MNTIITAAGRRMCLGGFILLLALGALRLRYSIAITDGESMAPTLASGDILVVDRWAFRDSPPLRGEVVIAQARGETLVKRVVGLPGEKLSVQAGALLVNGVGYAEEYTTEGKRLEIGTGELNPDRYALVGDNRSLTTDELVHAIAGSVDITGRVTWALRLSTLNLLQVY